jgi:hypothetical protein
VVAEHRVGRLALVADDVDVPDGVSPQSFDLGDTEGAERRFGERDGAPQAGKVGVHRCLRIRTSPALASGLIS